MNTTDFSIPTIPSALFEGPLSELSPSIRSLVSNHSSLLPFCSSFGHGAFLQQMPEKTKGRPDLSYKIINVNRRKEGKRVVVDCKSVKYTVERNYKWNDNFLKYVMNGKEDSRKQIKNY